MPSLAELYSAGQLQARLCRENGGPTYQAIIEAILADLDDTSAVVRLLAADPREPVGSALFLRLLGAVHRLALTRPEFPLRPYFLSTGGSIDTTDVIDAFFDAVNTNSEAIAVEMIRDVQTNEVGRAAPLSAAINFVTADRNSDVHLFELGASAGLNLWFDRYRITSPKHGWGPADSPLKLEGHFDCDPPLGNYHIVERRGCDLMPMRVSDQWDRTVLRSFVWPDDVERLARLDAAMSIAGEAVIERASAGGWLKRQLTDLSLGVTIIFHSILFPYLTDGERSEIRTHIEAAGRRADPSRRLAWVSLEPDSRFGAVSLIAERWPEHERLLLATSTPHGLDIKWAPRRVGS
jgi:hypothetical protein